MPATITATGVWTALTFTAGASPRTQNERRINGAQLAELAADDTSELNQFVEAVAAGYGINYHAAVALLLDLLTAKVNRAAPSERPSFTP